MKTVLCKKCLTEFSMDNNFIGVIFCEGCDPFLQHSERITELETHLDQAIDLLSIKSRASLLAEWLK